MKIGPIRRPAQDVFKNVGGAALPAPRATIPAKIHGSKGVSKVVIISGVPPYLLKTADTPEGLDGSVFAGSYRRQKRRGRRGDKLEHCQASACGESSGAQHHPRHIGSARSGEQGQAVPDTSGGNASVLR